MAKSDVLLKICKRICKLFLKDSTNPRTFIVEVKITTPENGVRESFKANLLKIYAREGAPFVELVVDSHPFDGNLVVKTRRSNLDLRQLGTDIKVFCHLDGSQSRMCGTAVILEGSC